MAEIKKTELNRDQYEAHVQSLLKKWRESGIKVDRSDAHERMKDQGIVLKSPSRELKSEPVNQSPKENPVPGYKGFLSGLTPNTRIEMAKADERDRIKSFWGGDKTSTYRRDVPMQSDFIAARDMEDSAPGEKVVPYKQSLMGKPNVENDVNVPRHLWHKSPSNFGQTDLPPIPGGRSPTEIAMAEEQRQESMKAREDAISGLKKRGAEKSADINKQLEGLDKKTKALEKEKAGNYFIDPGSGFALNLKKMREGNKRREVMDQAALLPAASRASFLLKAGYIDPEDMPEASALDQIKLKVAENQLANSLLKKKQLEQQGKDYMSPETKEHWNTFRSSIAAGNYELVMHMGKKIGMTDLEVEKMIEGDRKARVAAAKNSGMDKLWKNTFGENFSDYRKARDTTMKRAHDRLAMRTDDVGNEGKRTAFLEQYNLLDWDKAEAMIGQKTTTEDGQPSTAFNDWLRNRMARDPALAYARQVMPEKLNKGNYNTFLAHAMSITDLSNSYGWEGLQQRIRAEESDRQKFDEKVLNPESGGDTGDKPPPPDNIVDDKPAEIFKAKGAKSASQVLLQAQQAGFPDQYSGKEFIDQLNKSQGTKYSWPDNVPAEFPKFWGDKKSEIGLLERNLQEKLDKKDPKYEGAMALIDMFPEARRDASFSVSEVPRGDSIQKILEYGSKKIPESRWNDMKKGAYALPTLPGAYGRQPDFFREKKWDDKEGMYQYFFQNPEEMKQVPGEVRPQLIKEILEYIKTVDIKEK